MKRTRRIITAFLAASLAASCNSTEEKTTAAAQELVAAAAHVGKANTEVKAAAVSVQDYAFAQRAEFIDKMRKEMANIQGDLDRLSARANASSNAAAADAKVKVEAVRANWAQVKKQLDLAEAATESTWDEAKANAKKSYDEMKDVFEKTRQWLSDEIAP